MIKPDVLRELRDFLIMSFGELVFMLGYHLTAFALDVWVYQHTGSIAQFTLLIVWQTLPYVFIAPLAGVLVDRWPYRWTMIISDSCASLVTLGLALLLMGGRLEIWHIYAGTAISSCFNSFQSPAYHAATTVLVPKQHLGRANGIDEMVGSIAQLTAPLLAALLLQTIQLQGIMLLDFATIVFVIGSLLLVRFPDTKTVKIAASEDPESADKESILQEITYGWNYLTTRPGLLGLLIFFIACNFCIGVVEVLATPLVLSFASVTVLGTIVSISSGGRLVGSLLMTTWGGFQRQINTVLSFTLLSGLFIVLAGSRPSVGLFAVSGFCFFLGFAIMDCGPRVIFQKKVALEVQGRVFAFKDAIASVATPVAAVSAGLLADHIFEPLMSPGGALAGSIGLLIGVGPGRGMGLLYMIMGLAIVLTTAIAYQYPRLRQVEDELPDAIADEITLTSDEVAIARSLQ